MQSNDVGISVKVTNENHWEIVYQVYLKINGKTHDSKSVMLLPGSSQNITFIVTPAVPGDFEVEIDNLRGFFNVIPLQPRLID